MRTYNVIIVDDESEARALIQGYLKHVPNFELIAVCKNATEALQCINVQPIDLVFLDIQMPDISGVTFAKSIPESVQVIFTTAHREFALEGFELMAVDYLLKPVSLERFLRAVNKFQGAKVVQPKQIASGSVLQQRDFIFVKSDRKMVKIELEDIRFVESIQDYLKVHLKQAIVVTRETISNMEAQLPPSLFVRCHRSFIVSIKHISSFTHEHITLDKKSLPISRSYREEVLRRLNGNS